MTVGRRIVIAGGSGFIGRVLLRYLASKGDRVTILVRRRFVDPSDGQQNLWDGRTVGPWSEALDGADALVNLAGRSVDCVKTSTQRAEILASRVESTRALGEACRRVPHPPPVWVQMSTSHIYGDPPAVHCDENAPTGAGFAPDVGRAWEEAFHEAVTPTQRGVILRTAFVLGPRNAAGAGALARLAWLCKAGLGGRVASGHQGFSWIHIDDLCRLVDHAIGRPSMNGVYNAVAPDPPSQREFMRALRRHAGGLGSLGIALPAPAWLVRIGAPLILRTDPELAILGRYIISTRLAEAGFCFDFPTLDAALARIDPRRRS